MVNPSVTSSSDEEISSPNCENNSDNDVIDLSSDSEIENPSQSNENDADDSSSPASCSSSKESASSNSDADSEDDLTLIGELRDIQKSLRLKLNKFEKRAKRRIKLKLEMTNDKSPENGHTSRESMTVTGSGPNDESHQSSFLQSSVNSDEPQDSQNERLVELKRKLEMVTQELSQSRQELVKKTRMENVRETVPIEVPEYPMEFYGTVNKKLIKNPGEQMEDWFRAFNDHPFFQNQSEDYHNWVLNRTNDLLPQVLQIMSEYLNGTTTQLQGPDLLSCRLVSKSWKQSTDKFLQEGGASSLQVSTIYCTTNYKKVVDLTCALVKENELRLRLHHPFPSRSLIIKNHPLEWHEATFAFRDAMHVQFNMFGKEVHTFSYIDTHEASTFFDDADVFNRWTILHNWLTNMENLKTLKISFLQPSVAPPEVNTILDHRPFPVLAKLSSLECQRLPKSLINSILDANPHIQKLAILPVSGDQDFKWEEYKEMQNLTEFSLNVSNISHVEAIDDSIFLWPLKKLTLSSLGVNEELIELGKLFQILEIFQETLTHLELNLLVGSVEKCLSLKLPQVQVLKLSLRERSLGKGMSYDFLLPLKALENLEISLEQEEGANDELVDQVIQLRGFLDHLYDSNIWKVFPCLKKIEANAFCGEEEEPKIFKYTKR